MEINGGDKCEMNVRLFLAFMGIHHSNLAKDKCQWDMIGQNTLICVLSDLALRFSNRLSFSESLHKKRRHVLAILY